MPTDDLKAKATQLRTKAKTAERELTRLAAISKDLKIKARDAKRLQKQAKKVAKKTAKAARLARKAEENARETYQKATAKADKATAKAAKELRAIDTPKRTTPSRNAPRSTRRERTAKSARRRVWEVGEDTVDTEASELPELDTDVTAV